MIPFRSFFGLLIGLHIAFSAACSLFLGAPCDAEIGCETDQSCVDGFCVFDPTKAPDGDEKNAGQSATDAGLAENDAGQAVDASDLADSGTGVAPPPVRDAGHFYDGGVGSNDAGFPVACDADQHIEDATCVSDIRECDLPNGYGTQTWRDGRWEICELIDCHVDHHNENDICVADEQECAFANGTGVQTWTGERYGPCFPTSCLVDYHFEDGICTGNTRDCPIENGTGTEEWNAGEWTSCQLVSCDAGAREEGGICVDECPDDAVKSAPGVCGCGVPDIDTDNDGTLDCQDGCPDNPNKLDAGICGCAISDIDTDGDGTLDCQEECPDDPNKLEAGLCGCGRSDAPPGSDEDADNDGIIDCLDQCGTDPQRTHFGLCGCGLADSDVDANGNGYLDCWEKDLPVSAHLNGRDIEVKEVELNGTSTTLTAVSPGAVVTLRVKGKVQNTRDSCPNCITQFYAQMRGFFSFCLGSGVNHWDFDETFDFNAPTTPGTYFVYPTSSFQYECVDDTSLMRNESNAVFATIIVEP